MKYALAFSAKSVKARKTLRRLGKWEGVACSRIEVPSMCIHCAPAEIQIPSYPTRAPAACLLDSSRLMLKFTANAKAKHTRGNRRKRETWRSYVIGS